MSVRIECFEDILAWQKARELNRQIYITFKSCRDFSFCDQIKRASVSVTNNIAEGYERKGDKQLKHFLFIAKGSAGEVRSMLFLAYDLEYINNQSYHELLKLAEEISKMLSGFIKRLE
jgi:four helix bundle protein